MVNKTIQKMAFSTCCVDNAIVHASGDGNAKSPPPVGSRARWERGMALAAAVEGFRRQKLTLIEMVKVAKSLLL